MAHLKCSKSEIIRDGNLFSNKTKELFESASVKNSYEAFTVVFHSFMIESGFIPKGVAEKEKFQVMPANWKSREIYKILYCHSCCQEYTCRITCIPLYNTISVQGIVCDIDCLESVNIKVDTRKYSKETSNFNDIAEVFQSPSALCIYFKDGFCLPLLNLLHETIGCNPLFGLRGLLAEIKVHIMEFLPVEDILSLSSVNHEFNSLTNASFFWKFLFLRDFCKGGVPDFEMSTAENWKQRYKTEYMKKKRRLEPRVCLYYPYVLDPNIDVNVGFPSYNDPFEPLSYIFPVVSPRIPQLFRRLH